MLIEDESGVNDKTSDSTPESENQDLDTKGAEQTPSPKDEAPAKGADETGAGKTYTQEEVNRIMHERTKDYSSMKRDLETYRQFISEQESRAKQVQAPAAPQAPSAPELDEDDKKFKAYLEKMYPGMDKLSLLGKLDDKRMGFIEALQQKDEAEKGKFVDSSEQEVFKFCEGINAKDEAAKSVVRDAVAAAILNDPKLAEKWERRDPTVIADAIKVLETTLGKRTEVTSAQNLSSVKAKVEKIQTPMPKGGIPAPISKEKSLTEDERVSKAWDALQKQG